MPDEVLVKAWDGGFTVSSDFARRNAILVAAAASAGFITSLTPEGGMGATWKITPKGCDRLFAQMNDRD